MALTSLFDRFALPTAADHTAPQTVAEPAAPIPPPSADPHVQRDISGRDSTFTRKTAGHGAPKGPLGHLTEHPERPISVLRVNAPAREVLSQLHEFPSAGMEKAPDLALRIEAPAKLGERPSLTTARAWIADQR